MCSPSIILFAVYSIHGVVRWKSEKRWFNGTWRLEFPEMHTALGATRHHVPGSLGDKHQSNALARIIVV